MFPVPLQVPLQVIFAPLTLPSNSGGSVIIVSAIAVHPLKSVTVQAKYPAHKFVIVELVLAPELQL